MRKHPWERGRDFAVRLLARLSLVAALAVLGALFVGGAATSQASEPGASAAAPSGSSQQALLDQASPVGLVLGVLVIGAGFVVLTIGAIKPPTGRERRDYANLSRP